MNIDQKQLNEKVAHYVRNNDMDKVIYYLDAGADVNFAEDFFHSHPLLFWACFKNNKEMIKLLIERGADVNYAGSWGGNTLLHDIVDLKKLSCLSLLVENGANINAQNKSKETPLTQLRLQISNEKMIAKLLKLGADPSIKNNQNTSMLDDALHMIRLSEQDGSSWGIPIELAQFVVDSYNKIIPRNELPENKVNEDLLKAARNGHYKRLQSLISQGADLSYVDKNGNNALLLTAENGSLPCLEILVHNKIDYFHVNNFGVSALHLACLKGHFEFIKSLIKLKLDVNQKTISNFTPIFYAASNPADKVDILKYLIGCGADIKAKNNYNYTCFYQAILEGNKHCVEFFLENGEDVNQINENEETPILFASMRLEYNRGNSDRKRAKYIEIIELLAKHGADVNVYQEFNDRHVLNNIMYSKVPETAMYDLISKILAYSDSVKLDFEFESPYQRCPMKFAKDFNLPSIVRLFEDYQKRHASKQN